MTPDTHADTHSPPRHTAPTAVRLQAIDSALAQLEKSYGKGAVMRLGDASAVQIEAISSGCLSLDLATGIGGYPRGRVVEIYGPEASGKTTLTLQAIASCQAKGGIAAFVDAEHALDAVYARNLGVDIDNLLVAQPDHGEQALDIVERLVASGAVDLVVVDSVAALVPQAELEGDMGDQQMGLQARLMSKGLRKLTGIAHKTHTTVVFINQLRQKIGVVFGPSEVTPGGNALKFYCSLRLDVRRISSIKNGAGEVTGSKTRVKIVKNKLAPPFRQVEFDIVHGKGVRGAADLVGLAVDHGVLTRSGSWYSLGEQRLGNGVDKVKEALDADPALYQQVEALVRAAVQVSGEAEVAEA
jgi:recombination protein RecA